MCRYMLNDAFKCAMTTNSLWVQIMTRILKNSGFAYLINNPWQVNKMTFIGNTQKGWWIFINRNFSTQIFLNHRIFRLIINRKYPERLVDIY